jgi:hypothetical protein
MGERVFVRTSKVEPIEPDFGARIDYAKPDVNSRFPTVQKALAWLHYVADTVWQAVRPVAAKLLRDLGGRRQVAFAIGVMFVTGGLGAALAHDLLPIFWMAVGGLIVGLCVRVTGSPRKDA